MDILLTVSGNDLPSETVAAGTRELLKDIREDADPVAQLVKVDADADAKGALTDLGQIALVLITSGAVGVFIRALFGFLGRHRKLEIEVQNQARQKLKLKWDFVDRNGEEKAIALVNEFLSK
jgi:hypothetical protein